MPSAAPAASETAEVSSSQAPSASPTSTLGPLGRARVESTRAHVETVRMAVELWMATTAQAGACPTFGDLTRDKVLDPKTAHDDAWGQGLRIQCSDEAIEVRSAGPDRAMGTSDDVVSAGR